MERVKECARRLTDRKYLPFYFFAVIQLIYHCMMREVPGSDAMWFFRNQLDTYSLKDYLTIRYDTWSSRIIIEAVLVYVSRNMLAWKIIDWFMWMLFAVSLSKIFGKTENPAKTNWVLVSLILIYPLNDLWSAGWIATTTNYIWPLALGTFAMTGIAKVFRGEKIKWWAYVCYIPAALYAANAEQMCAVMLGIYTLCILYLLFIKKQGKQWVVLVPFLFICGAEFVFIMTCPGNGARKDKEIADYLQNYVMYNPLDKANLGLMDTVKHLLVSGNLLFLMFVVLMAVLVFQRTRGFLERLASMVPVAWTVVLTFFPDTFERHFPKLSSLIENNELINGYNYVWGYSYLPLVLYCLILLCVLVCLALIAKSWEEFFGYFFLLGIGLASRVVMGFSPTLFVSGERTFLYLYVTIIVAIAVMWEKNREELKQHPKMMQTLELGGACILIFELLGGLMSASAI